MIFVGCDHAGFALKEKIMAALGKKGFEFTDCGRYSEEPIDYPLVAQNVAAEVAKSPRNKGILACGSGIGMCMAANRVNGIRAAILYSDDVARLSREHNDANVACLGGRTMAPHAAVRRVMTFLKTPFSKEARHKRRVKELG